MKPSIRLGLFLIGLGAVVVFFHKESSPVASSASSIEVQFAPGISVSENPSEHSLENRTSEANPIHLQEVPKSELEAEVETEMIEILGSPPPPDMALMEETEQLPLLEF